MAAAMAYYDGLKIGWVYFIHLTLYWNSVSAPVVCLEYYASQSAAVASSMAFTRLSCCSFAQRMATKHGLNHIGSCFALDWLLMATCSKL